MQLLLAEATSDLMQAKGISFLAAWKIPGVAGFALTLFFAKLVAYAFLYWLPFYLSMGMGAGSKLSPQVSTAHSRVSCRNGRGRHCQLPKQLAKLMAPPHPWKGMSAPGRDRPPAASEMAVCTC